MLFWGLKVRKHAFLSSVCGNNVSNTIKISLLYFFLWQTKRTPPLKKNNNIISHFWTQVKKQNTHASSNTTTAIHMQGVLPLSAVCMLPWDNPLSCVRSPPTSAAPHPEEHSQRAAVSPAFRNLGDEGYSVAPWSRGGSYRGPQCHSAERWSHKDCSDRAYTPESLHPTSYWAGPVTIQIDEWEVGKRFITISNE